MNTTVVDCCQGRFSTARSLRAWIVLLAVMLLGTVADLASKHVAFARIANHPVLVEHEQVLALPPHEIGRLLPAHEAVVVVPSVLELTLVLNPGAVFGMGAGQRWFFVVFTLFAGLVGLWLFAACTRRRDSLAHAGIGLILSGGIGNLYDRLVYGCVRDFLHPLPGVELPFGIAWPGGEREVWPWVSNIADALLLLGVGILLVRLWVTAEPVPAATGAAKNRKNAASNASNESAAKSTE